MWPSPCHQCRIGTASAPTRAAGRARAGAGAGRGGRGQGRARAGAADWTGLPRIGYADGRAGIYPCGLPIGEGPCGRPGGALQAGCPGRAPRNGGGAGWRRGRMEIRIERLCVERGFKMTGQRRVIARVLSDAAITPMSRSCIAAQRRSTASSRSRRSIGPFVCSRKRASWNGMISAAAGPATSQPSRPPSPPDRHRDGAGDGIQDAEHEACCACYCRPAWLRPCVASAGTFGRREAAAQPAAGCVARRSRPATARPTEREAR